VHFPSRLAGYDSCLYAVPDSVDSQAGHRATERSANRNGFLEQLTHSGGASASVLCDRELELERLARSVSLARDGVGSLVAIEAGRGIGKSSLVAAAAELAGMSGVEVLLARGRKLERHFDFGVALQLLEPALASADDEGRERVLSGSAALAEALLTGQPEQPPNGQLLFSRLRALQSLCEHLAEERPLLLCLDDAHLADPPSLRFLLYLVERIASKPIAIVLTTRGAVDGVAGRLVAELVAHSATIVLRPGPLGTRGVRRVLRSSLFPHATKDFAAACREATQGNPSLLADLAVELASRGVEPSTSPLHPIGSVVPSSLSVSLAVKLRSVGTGALDLARAVAVLGGGELRHAAALCDLSQDAAARLADALRREEILNGNARPQFAFPIERQAVYREMPPAQRAEGHLHAARLGAEEGAPVERVAYHLLRGRASGSEGAVETLWSAAAEARREGRTEEAAEYLRRALEEPPPPSRRTAVLLELGTVEAIAGEEGAIPHLEQALEAMDDSGERARTTIRLAQALQARGRLEGAAAALRRALEEPAAADPDLRARLELELATATRLGLHGADPGVPDVRARPSLSRQPATATDRLVFAHASFDSALLGDPRERVVELAHAALRSGTLLEEETSDGLGYYRAAFALTVAEELEAAEHALTAAVEDARERGSAFGLATASYFRAFALMRGGRVRAAAEDVECALATRERGWRFALPAAHALLADCFLERGDTKGVVQELRLGDELEHVDELSASFHLASRGRWRLLQGRLDEALHDFLDCGRRLESSGVENPAVLPWRLGAAVALSLRGESGQARSLAEDDLALARSFGAPGAIGRSLTTLGSLVEGQERLDVLGEAGMVLEDSPCALDAARAQLDLGAALRRAGKRKAAREPLRRALDLAQRCDLRALAVRAEAEVKAAGARPRRHALTGTGALTPRERQVAELAADGLSNPAIGEALFVAIKTVEWHLRHAYRKLEVSSRGELGAALASRDDA
jgi:DNA-binding CsgD family transcriptional regulator